MIKGRLRKEKKVLRLLAFKLCLLLSVLMALPSVGFCSAKPQPLHHMNRSERNYWNELLKDNWQYLRDHSNQTSAMPYDSSNRQPVTSLTNAGLLLASWAAASHAGLVERKEALLNSRRILLSFDQLPQWRGLPQPWFLVRSLKPSFGTEFSYDSHIAVYIASLLVSAHEFPELENWIDKKLKRINLSNAYSSENGWLKGGYDVSKKNFSIYQSWGRWYYKYWGGPVRLLSYFGIRAGMFPSEHWERLVREPIGDAARPYLRTGLEESGLNALFLPTIFIDERKGDIATSQKNMIQAQMEQAQSLQAPVWGQAASLDSRGRYLAAGELQDLYVAPYASVLAALYFPEEAMANLKKLEELGARPEEGYGFRDSYDWQGDKVCPYYLTPSQGMSFLALMNLLHDGWVWQAFEASLNSFYSLAGEFNPPLELNE